MMRMDIVNSVASKVFALLQKYYSLGVLFLAALFLLLLWRNPFSVRTLIPNFEPFPDSFHYIVPVRNLLSGKEMLFSRDGYEGYSPSVPVLYSLVLLPAFILHNDPRMFYFVNVVLAFVSFFLFERIANVTIKSAGIRLLLLFLFVTSSAVSWVPSLAMAENLLLPLILLGIWLSLLPVTTKRSVAMGLLTWAFYGTKYAAAPLTALFSLFFLWKVGKERTGNVFQRVLPYLFSCLASFSIFSLSEFLQKGRMPFISLLASFFSWFSSVSDTATETGLQSFFSLDNIPEHWPRYMSGLFGGEIPFLWQTQPILLSVFAIFGGLGILFTLFIGERKQKYLAAFSFLAITVQATFMSTFYVVDMRFLYPVFPLLLFGLGEYLYLLESQKIFALPCFKLGVLSFAFFFAVILQFDRVKAQISLNLKYAETPWYYLSIQLADAYISQQTGEAVLISAIDPYLIDFYKTGSYQILPLSEEQNHTPELWPQIWGSQRYDNFIEMYRTHLLEGKELYALQYGQGNEKALHDDWRRLEENFQLTLVQEGCHSLCGVYKVEVKQGVVAD